MKKVKAKFTCNCIIDNGNHKSVQFNAVYDNNGENASFSKATPSGFISMNIDKETPAADFFEMGNDYYLTFEAVK